MCQLRYSYQSWKKESIYKDNNDTISSFQSGLTEFSLCNHTSCMVLSGSLLALSCSNWPFQIDLRIEKDFWNYRLHIYSVIKSTYPKKQKSKSAFQGGKGCKTSSGTQLADADGHSTSKYCLPHQNTFCITCTGTSARAGFSWRRNHSCDRN